MIHLEKENFKELISKGNHLVDFYAEWCGPCKMMGPVLEELDEKIDIIKVDIDKHTALTEEYKIMSVPTLKFIKDGEIIHEEVGFMPKEKLEEKLNEIFK